ncbi:MAG: Ig-like domain-containing protein [bacterium JZ-2024 1]
MKKLFLLFLMGVALFSCQGGGLVPDEQFFQGVESTTYIPQSSGIAVRAHFFEESDVQAALFYADNRFAGADYLPPFGVLIPSSWTSELGNSFPVTIKAYSRSRQRWFSFSTVVTPFSGGNVPVSVRFLNPLSGETIRDKYVPTLASVPDRIVYHVDFYLDSLLWSDDFSSPFESLWNSQDYLNGEHRLSAVAYFFVDSQPVQMSITIPVVIANTLSPPTLTFLTPADNAEVSGEVLLQVNSNEFHRLRRVRFILQDEEIFSDTIPPYEKLLDTRKYPDGDYVIIAEGERDFGGSLMEGILVHFHNGNPVKPVEDEPVRFLSPADGSVLSGSVLVRVQYSSLKIEEVRFFLDRTPLFADFSFPFEFWWDTTNHPRGDHLLRLIARDRAGFYYTSQIRITLE